MALDPAAIGKFLWNLILGNVGIIADLEAKVEEIVAAVAAGDYFLGMTKLGELFLMLGGLKKRGGEVEPELEEHVCRAKLDAAGFDPTRIANLIALIQKLITLFGPKAA